MALSPANPPSAPQSWRARVFAMSWISYFSYYFTRMPFKAAKTTLKKLYGLPDSRLNYIDTVYSAMYCIGQFGTGFLVDWLGPRRCIALGMLTSAVVAIGFQLVHSFTGIFFAVIILLWGINGFAQASGWTGNLKLMASWFGSKGRGTVMGWWATCYQMGGLVATFVAARMLDVWGWHWVFIGPALWVAIVAIAFWIIVRDRPSKVGFCDPDSGMEHATGDAAALDAERKRLMRAAWPTVLRSPMVWCMGGAYFCCKLIRYSMLFWLPFYLETALHYKTGKSLYMSMAFDAGGIAFVVMAGYVADRVFHRRRVLTAFIFLLGLVGAIFLYNAIGEISDVCNVAGMLLVGGCLFAADSLISGAVAQDLGGPHAAALASGLINGIGSVGQIVQGFLLVWITRTYGWSTLFDFFAILAGAGAAFTLPFIGVKPKSQ